MIEVQKCAKNAEGFPVKVPCWDRDDSGYSQAIFYCPNGHAGCLKNHTVAADGAVSPSVVCERDCNFHDYIKLLDWAAP